MQYKGDDLDLRVPQPRTPRDPGFADYDPFGNGRWQQQAPYGASSRDPLWVDETVLACCNYAFDIALANGSPEVGLEHLVNAFTRVEGAARVLEARGVREAQLRRDSATLLASEIPMSNLERVTPRRSTEFEEVLRRACETASRRGGAASVDDIIWVLLHWPREVSAVQLLRRLTPDWQRLEWSARPREYAPPRAEFARTVASAEPMLRSIPGPGPVAYASPFEVVSSRIAMIEDSLRALHAEQAGERKALSDLIRDMQRDVAAQRGDAAALRGDISQRLEMLERGLQNRPDSARMTVLLSDRIQTLEKAVNAGLGDGARNWAALGQRLQAIETVITAPDKEAEVNRALLERIDQLEKHLANATPETGGTPQILERIAGIEQNIEGRLSQSQRIWSGFTERLQSVERLAEAGAGESGRNWTAISERLDSLAAALRERPIGSGSDFADLIERVGGLEGAVRSGFGDSVRTTSGMSERLELLEKIANAAQLEQQPPDADTVVALDDRMQSIERLLQDQLTTQQPGTQARADLTQRLSAIEQQIAAAAEHAVDTSKGRERDVAELHEAIVRLSENQHTLAATIADWRHESQSDLGLLTAQVERVSEPMRASLAADPVAMEIAVQPSRTDTTLSQAVPPGTAANDLAALDRGASATPSIEQKHPRGHGFWWWLFGTDDIRRSNREAEIRWQHMRERLKDSRDRRRGERV